MNNNEKGVYKRYVLVGIASISTDLTLYATAISLGLQNFHAKAISFVFGMTLSFFLNRSFTFRTSETRFGKIKFMAVYLSALLANVSINNFLLTELAQDKQFSKFVAFLLASGTAIVINFVGMNYIVFKRQKRVDFE